MEQIQSKLIYILVTYELAKVCNLVLIWFAQAEYKKVNKHPKFYDNFDILRLLEHFEYEMNRTFVTFGQGWFLLTMHVQICSINISFAMQTAFVN